MKLLHQFLCAMCMVITLSSVACSPRRNTPIYKSGYVIGKQTRQTPCEIVYVIHLLVPAIETHHVVVDEHTYNQLNNGDYTQLDVSNEIR